MARGFSFFNLGRKLAPVLAGAFAAVLMASVPAVSASLIEKNFWLEGPRYDGHPAPCVAMQGTVASRFAEKESKFWNSDLQITGFLNVREIALRPWKFEGMPRRYCTGKVTINDGSIRDINFVVVEDAGFAGIGDSVEFCVRGLDRNWAYNPACRMARP